MTPDASDLSPEASTIRKAIKLAPTLMGTLEASGDGALTRATVDWPLRHRTWAWVLENRNYEPVSSKPPTPRSF